MAGFPVPSYYVLSRSCAESYIHALYTLFSDWNVPNVTHLANSCSFLKMWLKHLILFEAFLTYSPYSGKNWLFCSLYQHYANTYQN